MKVNRGTISWARRVFAVDAAAGNPILVRAEKRGAGITWRPCALASAATEMTDKDLLVAGLRVGPGMTTWLTTALLDARKVRQILPSVLDTKIPFALEDCAYRFSDTVSCAQPGLPVSGAGTAALSVVVRRSDLALQEAAFGRHSLGPHLFDHEGLALWSSLTPRGDDDVLQVVVWCRPSSMLVVLGLGRMYWSSHQVEGYDLERVMQIIRLQKQTLAQGRYKDVALAWHIGGDEERVGVLQADLEEGGRAQPQVLPDGSYYLARTLAERVLLPGPWRLAPLISAGRQAVYEKLLQRRYSRNFGMILACVALVLAGVLGRRAFVQQQIRKIDVANARVVQSIVGYPVAARGRHAVRVAEEELAARRTALAGFVPGEDLSEVGGRMAAAAAAEGGYVQHLLLEPDAARVTLWLPEDRTPVGFISTLEELGLVAGPVETGDTVAGMVEFRLRAERGRL